MKQAHYYRRKGISMQEMNGVLFLANDESGSIYHLNAIGAAFWRALDFTCDLDTIVNLFCSAFPAQSRSELWRDITYLASQLEQQGLILRKET